ncbi:MAG: T9SS type A sorting domain-containing protein [Bacteroidota bacterium]
MTATGYTGTLLWNTGATTPSITVTTAGIYTVTQNVSGCTSQTGNGTAAPFSLPPVPIITQIGGSLESSPAEFYQWFIDLSTIPQANGQTYTPIKNGSYTVEITDGNGCSQTSSAFLVLWVGLAENEISNAVYLFPNPSAEFYMVTSPQYMTFNQICVFDATGRLIKSYVLPDFTSKQQFDSKDLPTGTYVISVHTSMGRIFKKLYVIR